MSKYVAIKDTYLRQKPSVNSKAVKGLKKGATVNVVSKPITVSETKNSKQVKNRWVEVISCNKTYYVKYIRLKKETINYGLQVGSFILPTAHDIVSRKVKHHSGLYNYDHKRINCNIFVCYCLYKGGCLAKGKYIYHHEKGPKGLKNVKHYKWVTINDGDGLLYKDLKAEYKKLGCVYFYKGSVAIKGQDGVYACHSSGKVYNALSMVRHGKSSYEYTHKIIKVGVPIEE